VINKLFVNICRRQTKHVELASTGHILWMSVCYLACPEHGVICFVSEQPTPGTHIRIIPLVYSIFLVKIHRGKNEF
jgi:hypothetical protein